MRSSENVFQKNDIVIGDGGKIFVVTTAAYVLKLEWPQLWMDPGPLGTLGVGPGYAMAAKLARPDSNVVLVYGDGSFGLHARSNSVKRWSVQKFRSSRSSLATTQGGRRSAADGGSRDVRLEPRAVATALEYTRYRKSRRKRAEGFGAYVEKKSEEQLGPALDEAFASGTSPRA